MASNTLLESVAAFESQAKRVGLNEQWIEAFGRNDLNKLGRLAYAVTTPGVAPTTEQVTEFMNQLRFGVGPTLSEITAVKPCRVRSTDIDDCKLEINCALSR